jgi:hypothetical protein
MNKKLAAVAVSSLLLTGCAAGEAASAPTSSTASPSPSATPQAAETVVPNLLKDTAGTAAVKLEALGAGYDVVQDGKKLALAPGDLPYYKVLATNPASGQPLTKGLQVILVVAPIAPPTPVAPKVTGLAATLPAQFPGYPLIVHGATLDYRVANWFKGKLVGDQVVALIPGVYTPYNPNVKNLLAYYENGGDGDSVMRKQYMPDTGGAGWSGVLPGPEEPK